ADEPTVPAESGAPPVERTVAAPAPERTEIERLNTVTGVAPWDPIAEATSTEIVPGLTGVAPSPSFDPTGLVVRKPTRPLPSPPPKRGWLWVAAGALSLMAALALGWVLLR